MAGEPGGFRSGSRVNLGGETKALLWCLALATVLWVLLALNEPYNSTIDVKVNYINRPALQHYVKPLPEELHLIVSAKGWDLLGFALRGKGAVNIDLQGYERHNYILTTRLKGYLQQKLTHHLTIYDISPDTIPLRRSKLQTKKLPVRLDLALQFEREHNVSNTIAYSPDSITVSGPEAALRGLEYVSTEPIRLNKVEKTIKTTVNIKKPQGLNLTFSNEVIVVEVPVEKLTEVMIDVPVDIINLRGDYKVKMIPARVQLTYRTTLNNFGRINPNLFEAVVDGSRIDTLHKRPLKVQLVTEPKFTYDIRLKQEYVDYIITR
jgi:hypothetical protein